MCLYLLEEGSRLGQDLLELNQLDVLLAQLVLVGLNLANLRLQVPQLLLLDMINTWYVRIRGVP